MTLDKNYIKDTLKKLGQKYGVRETFEDFVYCCAYSLSNLTNFNDSREKEYLNMSKKYEKEDFNSFASMLSVLILELNKYGYADWYNWRCDNWGTKWDLAELDYNKDTMIFQTAWNFAGNVILELSRRYPEAVFECKFADEGMQENSGILKIKDGEVFEEKYNLEMESIDKIWDYYLDDSEKESSNEEIDNEIEMEY